MVSKPYKRRKKQKENNIAMNATKISLKMKNKSWLSIEKYIMKCEKVNETSLNRFQFLVLRVKMGYSQSRLRFLTIRVVEIGAILGQSEAFETKYKEFLYQAT